MDKQTLTALEQALESSPDNHLLRSQIALAYFDNGNFTKAKEHYQYLLQSHPARAIKISLAKCYLELENYSAGLIICEELESEKLDESILSTYIHLLIKDGQFQEAITKYQDFQHFFPGWSDRSIESKLKIPAQSTDDDNESIDYQFLEKPDMDFSKVGGMDEVKEEINIKIIQPALNPELFKAYGKKAGGGILMYGPPGCGKTYLSKATAGEIDARFLAVGIDEVLDMWMGNSEKLLHQKFEIARQHKPCVMFFDEIDALGSKRSDLRQSAGRNLINQFLKEMDGLNSDNENLLILGATNSPWHMDSAFLRPGRFDRIIFVPPPDMEARVKILQLKLHEKPVAKIDHEKIAKRTEGFSGADLDAVIDVAVENKLRQSMKSGKIEKLRTDDFLAAAKKLKPSTKEWFNTARNYALYSNVSGLYDDILAYLKL